MINDDALKEWERLANEATPGPWYVCGGTVCTVDSNDNRDTCPEPIRHCAELKCFNGKLNGNKIVFPDQEFAAAAREAAPALIARVRELEKEAAWLAVQCERLDFAGRDAHAWRRFAQEVAENG